MQEILRLDGYSFRSLRLDVGHLYAVHVVPECAMSNWGH